MRTNVLPEVKSYSVMARIIAYVLLFVPVGYLAVVESPSGFCRYSPPRFARMRPR